MTVPCTDCGKPAMVRISKVEQIKDYCERCWRVWRRNWDMEEFK